MRALSLTLAPAFLVAVLACAPTDPITPGDGEGEGEEGEEGEGEEGEGEGEEGEGEGEEGEGEGEEGEGEGEGGEGEGEGDVDVGCPAIENRAGAPLGRHCLGTDLQDIDGVEHVVFVGDSVTVGTPPTPSAEFYRSLLAEDLAARFGLEAPGALWKAANPLDGVPAQRHSGDFSACAKWGGRTDDLVQDNTQLADCVADFTKRTLIVVTVGGNDVFQIGQSRAEGAPVDVVAAEVENHIAALEDALAWVKTPGRFPNGVFVVLANSFEFTDRTGDTTSCPGAAEAGFDADFAAVAGVVPTTREANQRYLELALEYGIDVVFMEEAFCGHGYARDRPEAGACFAPQNELYFDLTCIHPNPAGHARIAQLFEAVIDE